MENESQKLREMYKIGKNVKCANCFFTGFLIGFIIAISIYNLL